MGEQGHAGQEGGGLDNRGDGRESQELNIARGASCCGMGKVFPGNEWQSLISGEKDPAERLV